MLPARIALFSTKRRPCFQQELLLQQESPFHKELLFDKDLLFHKELLFHQKSPFHHEMTARHETPADHEMPARPVFDDPRYREFFALFNRQAYYEAHEVLEGPWHEVRPDGPNATFFKGLIQLAGAFCHLKWHFEAPQHRIHGRRLRPAVKLFDLAAANLRAYPSPHLGVDLTTTLGLATHYRDAIIAGNFRENPWTTHTAPSLVLAV